MADFTYTGSDVYDRGMQRFEQDQQNALAKQAGGMIAGGDYTGAANALYKGGYLDQGAKIQAAAQQQQDAKLKREAEGAQTVAKGIRAAIAAGHSPQEAYDYATKIAPQLGIDPNHLTQLKPYFDQNPQAWLDMVDQRASQELEFIKSSDGSYSAVPKTGDGRPIYQYQAPRPPQYRTVGQGENLVEVPASAPQGAAPDASGNWLSAVAKAAPDAQVTSGYRTPEHNAEVGGRPNSRHLAGQAVDLVPRPGETMAQLYARVSNIPGTRAINEGDHVHVQVAGQPQSQGGARVIASGPAKPQARAATAQEKAAYGIPADVPAQVKPDGSVDVISGVAARNKPAPAAIQKGYTDNAASMSQIDQAISALQKNPGAMGLKNSLGDEIMQRFDPDGVETRAAVANIGSLVIHDRSGAAVTAAETPRLKPFIPMPTDTAQTAIKKLRMLKQQYANNNAQIEVQYGADSGYAPIGGQGGVARAQPSAPRAAAKPQSPAPPKPGQVVKGYRYNGGDPANPKSWSKV